MPKSIESSSEFDFSNEPTHHQQPSNASVSSHGSKEQQPPPPANLSMAVAAVSNCKKYRHQNFSKNIYIGTKNAEKWEKVRSVLSFKNDVEFVSYLLRLSDIDLADNNGLYSRESLLPKAPTLSTVGGGGGGKLASRKGSHEKFTTDTDTDQESLPASTFRGNQEAGGSLSSSLKSFERTFKAAKKPKRVQFQDVLSPGAGASSPPNHHSASHRPHRPATPNIVPGIPMLAAARLFESAAEFRRDSQEDDEVLDCRIAEKIKTELKEYKARSDGKNMNTVRENTEELTGDFDESQDEGDKEKEGDADDDDVGNNMGDCAASDFEKAMCLAAALKQSTEIAGTPIDRPLKRKGRPPTKTKMKAETGGTRKRAAAKIDIRKAPTQEMQAAEIRAKMEGGSGESDNDLSEDEDDQFHNNSENSLDSDKGASHFECSYCDEIHSPEGCPMRQATMMVCDSIEKFRWMEENRDILEQIKPEVEIKPEDDEIGDLLEEDNVDEDLNDASSDEDENTMDIKAEEASSQALLLKRKEEEDRLPSYCDASVPEQFDVVKSEVIGNKVTARTVIPKHLKLGPLVGQIIHVKDIPDDCTMKDIYEIYDGSKSYYISTSNKNESNWLRYIRPAPTRDQRNVVIVWSGDVEGNVSEVYFITCKDIGEGSELFYWSDHMNSAWGRKKIDKMNCGGCNLKFEHPLYYRTHCSVFHDPAFSLTIRKYHCKVCGLAVLGKDNIMQHAAEQHDGKGAYQCQFCKKYFLRLNYLEMHRTYGCSANPQRARPLCDFCGRKFCQPQKLKVHIKRMHSDMADVLRDFQCKLCSKLLGSRAALQRHSKEVHSRNSAVVSCPRCQKLFQNRSNLKIHMLTHSGVRPFKCAENGCSAAFTTKQCLQFHYKKVHGYTQEQMPKIERSIAYTFDAYSGGMKVDFLAEQLPRRRRKVSVSEDSKSLMQNFATAISERKRTKANESDNGDLCNNEPNLSLLSSKISSLLSQELKHAKKLKKKMMLDTMINNPDSNSVTNMDVGMFKNKASVGVGNSGPLSEENLNAFKMRLFGAAGNSHTDSRNDDLDEDDDDQSKDSILGNASNKTQINLVETFLNNSTGNTSHLGMDAQNSLQLLQNQLSEQSQNPFNTSGENSFNINAIVRNKDFIAPSSASILTSGLIPSKGSKKWMDNEHHNIHTGQQQLGSSGGSLNRNFLSRLINNGGVSGHQGSKFGSSCAVENDDESSILDVVDNQNGQNKNGNMPNQLVTNDQSHHQQFEAPTSFQEQISQLSQLPHSAAQFAHHHLPLNSMANFGNPYCDQGGEMAANNTNEEIGSNLIPPNANTDMGRIIGSSASSGNGSVAGNASASLLVEAALNSVSQMIDGDTSDQVDNCDGKTIKNRLSSRNEPGMNVESMSSAHENPSQSQGICNSAMGGENGLEGGHQIGSNGGIETPLGNDSGSYNDDMQDIENEVKLMKSLNNFQLNHNVQSGGGGSGAATETMQFPLSQQSSSSSNNGNHNQMNNTNSELMHENEIDVDNASTPRTLDRDSTSFRNYPPTTTPSPRDISPGQDYTQSQRLTESSQQQMFGVHSPIMNRTNSYVLMNDQMGATPSPVPGSNLNQHNPSPPIIPRYGFSLNDICRKREYSQGHQQHQQQQHLSSDEDSIMAQNLSVNHGQAMATNSADSSLKMKGNNSQYKYSEHNSNENPSNLDLVDHFQRHPPPASHGNNTLNQASANEQINEIGLDMSSRISGYSHHNFQLSAAAAAVGLNRYHHHIYDILSEREQQQQQVQKQNGGFVVNGGQQFAGTNQPQTTAQYPAAGNSSSNFTQGSPTLQWDQSQQMSDHTSTNGLSGMDQDGQTTSVDLSRTTSYVVTSPPAIPYAGHPHSHSEMLRMVSMELTGANGNSGLGPNAGNIIGSNNHRPFAQHNNRLDAMESLHHHHRMLTSAEQHRLLASNTAAAAEQLTNSSTNRLLVDPAHILMESNNRGLLPATSDTSRLLGDGVAHRHMARDFGSYHHHHHHQVAAATANNYHHHGGVHHPLARPSAQSNHHSVGATNYHPFPTYY